MLICVVTVCTLLYNYAYTHGLPMPNEAFFIEIQNFWAWADKLWGIFGQTKGQLISKCPYEKSVSTKIPTKIFLEFCPEIFCSFLGASWGLG